MTRLRYPFLFLALILLAPPALADFAVIIHRDNTASISRYDIAKIFLGKTKKYSDGSRALAINLPDDAESKIAFDNWFIGKSPSQMKSHWSIVIFTGKGTPLKTVENDSDVIEIVSQNPEAIGYVRAIHTDERVRILFTY